MTTKITSSVLADTGVTAGTYGSTIIIPVTTVDSQGRITLATNNTIRSATTSQTGVVQLTDSISSTSTTTAATPSSVKSAYDRGSLGITTADTKVASVSASTGVTIGGTATAPTVAIGQAVATSSSVQFGSMGVGTAASGTAGEIRATNNITAYYSDDRLKTKLGNIDNALDKLMTLSGFYYEANETAQQLGYEPVREVGVSAQQVQEVMPEVVAPAPIDEQYLTVRYERLVPLIIESIKELKKQIDELKK
jgi:hypothetical protein